MVQADKSSSKLNVESPRRRLRNLVKRRQSIALPLFFPLMYAVAAQIEGVDELDLLSNATKLSNSLTALHGITEVDGIVCFKTNHEVSEALGAKIEWDSYPPNAASPAVDVGAVGDSVLQGILRHPRVDSGLEVIRRLTQTIKGDPVLIAVLAGPATLAMELSGSRGISPELMETAGSITTALSRAFCEAGAHLILLKECTSSLPGMDNARAWHAALTTVANVAGFFGVLPIILFNRQSDELAVAYGKQPVAGLCSDAVEAAQSTAAIVHCLDCTPADWQLPEFPCDLLTTALEVPARQDIGELREACLHVREQLRSE